MPTQPLERADRQTRSAWARAVCQVLATCLLALSVWLLIELVGSRPTLVAVDLHDGYLPAAQRFIDTGSPYEPYQVAGPWQLDYRAFIHPPSALLLFVPFLALPAGLWWAIPLIATAYAVNRLRPAPWAWVVMAACLCWPRSTGSLVAGNTDMWVMAAVAAGAVWGWPIVLLAVKPTFAPLGIVALRDRRAWIAGVLFLLAMLPLLPLWLEWAQVITNNDGLGIGYSLLNLPLAAVGAIAWVSTLRRRNRAAPARLAPLPGAQSGFER